MAKINEKPAALKKAGGRLKFQYDGRTIYEWEQSLEEVLIFIKPPPGITAAQINCKITSTRLTLGLMGADKPFIDEEFPHRVKVDDSMWTLDNVRSKLIYKKWRKLRLGKWL